MPTLSRAVAVARRVAVEPRPRRFDRTTREWLWIGVSSTLAVLFVLGTVGAWVFARSSADATAVVDRRSPALIQAVRLESAFVDQETGTRGYGLSGAPDYLQPYIDGLAEQATAVGSLRSLLADDPGDLEDLNRVLAAADAWQTAFARPVAAAAPDAVRQLATERSAEGKILFDKLRADSVAQQAHLQFARSSARDALRAVDALRDWIFATIGVVIFVVAVLVFEGLRRGVTNPLAKLAADARQVTDGDLDHAIEPTGPADLQRLAADVEGMRQRLLSELALADEARRLLDAQAAELQRSNGELEQFAYVASHDLQEPLRKVASFCQLLQRRYAGQLDERADQYIGFAVDGANRMQTLIQDLLAFSRVGRTYEPHTDVDLEEILADAVDFLSLAVSESGALITHDPLPTVTGDRTQLGMLFQNLLGNALKFRDPARPAQVHVSCAREGDRWALAVSDNGIGIGADYAERVFTIFQRLHARDAYTGNGIGLAVCRKIVEFHGGEIAVDPEHSPGARLVFTLPADETAAAEAPSDETSDEPTDLEVPVLTEGRAS